MFGSRQTLHVPHLLDVEVARVIRRYAATAALDAERGRVALTDLADFPLRRYPHDLLLPRVWTCGTISRPALAEALEAPLLTRDQRLAAAAGHYAKIELV